MNDEPRVWIRKRQCKRGKVSYHLRWICPTTCKWRSCKIGPDRKRAERAAALLEKELAEGTYRDLRPITWADFVKDHVSKIPRQVNRGIAERVLNEFGDMYGADPRRVTYTMIEAYASELREREERKNTTATINKKLRYLRAAFNRAVKRGYIAKNPMDGWQWVSEDRKAIRIATADEESALLETAEKLYGFRMRAFVYVALNTGGRRGELLTLTWSCVDLDGKSVTFTETKGKRDRRVPIAPEVVAVLRRLQLQTLQAGGPFADLANNRLTHRWRRIVEVADVEHITIHDLRRSYVTRLVRAGVPLPTVQKLVGHATIQTTLRYYNYVSDEDMREGVERLRKAQAAG